MIAGLLGIFGSKLLSLFLKSAFHSFPSKCLCYKDKQWWRWKCTTPVWIASAWPIFWHFATVILVSTHTLGVTGLDQQPTVVLAAATSIINSTPEPWWESLVASFPQIHNHFHIVCWGWVKHTQVCNFCISEAFNEIKSKHFSNAWRYSSFCVISYIRQSVAQKLDKIHVFYARKFCRPT